MSDGLSLFGFLQQEPAINYLRGLCALQSQTKRACLACWHEARAKLGAPFAGAGQPAISEIPRGFEPYLDGVRANPRYADTIGTVAASFKMVEIDPLLAYQFHIELGRAGDACAGRPPNPPIEDLLSRCLPQAPIGPPALAANVTEDRTNRTVRITSSNLNLRVIGWGPARDPQSGDLVFDPGKFLFMAGITFGESSSLLQVVRFDGRCYLKNGYHRVYALRRLGATQVPCVFLEATDYSQVHTEKPGRTFARSLLESANPPTIGHFTQGRAYNVPLRSWLRLIQLQWSEDLTPA